MDQVIRDERQLAAALRRERKRLSLTQSDLASSAQKRQATISNLEAGAGGTLETLFSVLRALELELVVRPRKRGPSTYDDLF
ncbi:helix-turn-helix domain-containing protein [Phenylobacterium sp. LjRoot164]|uniref:helix-turn-helix domain-containing protein n=1 Tax=unclassified Phenylobacterium TaxID=2640670 RepID=UPI003ECE57CD